MVSLYVESLRGVHAQLKPLQTSVKVSTEHAPHTVTLPRGHPRPVPTVTLPVGNSLLKCLKTGSGSHSSDSAYFPFMNLHGNSLSKEYARGLICPAEGYSVLGYLSPRGLLCPRDTLTPGG